MPLCCSEVMPETTEQHERRGVPWERVFRLSGVFLILYVLSYGPMYWLITDLTYAGIVPAESLIVWSVTYYPLHCLCRHSEVVDEFTLWLAFCFE